MQTEAVFENIAERIQREIKEAQESVFIAIAWFTNQKLFDSLLNKAENGCRVSLIVSNNGINQNSSIDFELLNSQQSNAYKVGDGNSDLMHNKFCVIDHNTVITGSYNWSYKAESNTENVIITKDDTTLAEQYISEFNQIRKRYFPDETKATKDIEFPLEKIIKRLEIFKNHIQLEDIEELNQGVNKLKKYDFNRAISAIIDDFEKEAFSSAVQKIETFISKNRQVTVWSEPEILALKLEIKTLENQLNAFDNEKIELEKTLAEFQHRHTTELGDIILEILELRKQKFKTEKEKYEETNYEKTKDKEAKYEEAKQDEQKYRQQVRAEKEKEVFELNNEQQAELKNKFRKASIKCHPDRVSDEFKEEARRTFVDLKDAYDKNDLETVTEILDQLDNGNYIKTKSETITKKDLLKAEIEKLSRRIQTLEKEITTIKESETYQTINDINDWDEYFISTKEKLEIELESLETEMEEA